VPARAPHLHAALRAFCLAAFARLGSDDEIPYVLERSASGFTEYRPLVADHIQARAHSLSQLPDAQIALDELGREPAAAIYAGALFRAVLLPLLVGTAEACGGFDWEDGAFERAYAELEGSLYGAARTYSAVAPLVGLSAGAAIELGRGIVLRPSAAKELEAAELVPPRFGEEPERTCVLALERELAAEDGVPDTPAELADAVTALRLATGGPVAAGPVVFEWLARHPLGMRPLPGIAATEPAGEPTRLDPWRGRLAADLLDRLAGADGEALERWQLSLFEDEPGRSERLREALAALLGGADGLWAAAMRAAVLVGEPGLRSLARGDQGEPDAVRRAIVETLLHDDRDRLLAALDDALLGLRARPPGYFSFRHESGTAA
jgi:hypothetical protein